MSDFAIAQDKAMGTVSTGLYIHVPFCARSCDYCAFYQSAPDADAIRRYFEALRQEAGLIAWPAQIETVFWGGGTPGLLSPKDLLKLGALVREFSGGRPREWSVEMTPLSVTEARIEALKEAGVTRISLGVQSFQPRLLDALGRQHTPEQAFKAAERLHAAGFDNVNYDLMFALPGQDDEDWMRDLDQAIALAPAHISTYCLTFEEDTKLWLKLSQGKIRRDVEAEARLYTATWERLAAAGYGQYEISNFARPGRACLHNLNTWRMQDWIGLGPSAASQQAGWRGTNIADLDKWCAEVAAGRRAGEDRQELSPGLLAEDALIFGLRMNEGVDLAPLRARAPGADWAAVDAMAGELREGGLADVTGSWIRLTPRGRLLADSVGERLLGLLSS